MITNCFTFHSGDGDGGHGDGRGGAGDDDDDDEVRLICGRDGDGCGGGRGGCCDGRRRSQWHRRCPQLRPLRWGAE